MSGMDYIKMMNYEVLDFWKEADGHTVYCVKIGNGYNDIHDYGTYFYIN